MKTRLFVRSISGLLAAAAVALPMGCKDSKATAPVPRLAVKVTPTAVQAEAPK